MRIVDIFHIVVLIVGAIVILSGLIMLLILEGRDQYDRNTIRDNADIRRGSNKSSHRSDKKRRTQTQVRNTHLIS